MTGGTLSELARLHAEVNIARAASRSATLVLVLRAWIPLALVMLACGLSADPLPSAPLTPPPAAPAASDRIGQHPPDFDVAAWIVDPRLAAGPASLAALHGQVVLVRFWTDTCPYCKATAPALVALDRDFRDQGLVVLGFHHPKPKPRGDAPVDVERQSQRIAEIAASYGFRFAIGLDWQWRTLQAWWLDHAEPNGTSATSATVLIDARGVIRWVHPGPEYHPDGPEEHVQCRADYAELRAMITRLLAERSEQQIG